MTNVDVSFDWTELEEALNTQISSTLKNTPCLTGTQVFTDSRHPIPGGLFVPLKGEQFDGHDYIDTAMAGGAKAFLVEKSRYAALHPSQKDVGIPIENPLLSYQKLARLWRTKFTIPIIAITGSNGKTTVKDMASSLLTTWHPVLKTEKNFNNEVGVPKTLLSLTPAHRFAVIEMGARKPGDIGLLCQIALPTVATLLNVGSAHLGIFGSLDQLRHTKMEMFFKSPPHATLIAPADDQKLIREAKSTHKKLITFGSHPDAIVRLVRSEPTDSGFVYEITSPLTEVVIEQKEFHGPDAINFCAAVAIGMAVGMPANLFANGFAHYSAPKGRFHVIHGNSFMIIDDSYNANPESLLSGLQSLKIKHQKKRILTIIGDMLELGEDSKALHETSGGHIALLAPKDLVAVGRFADDLAKGAIEAGFPADHVIKCQNVKEVIEFLDDKRDQWDLIYLKASHSLNFDQVVSFLENPSP